MRRLPPLGALRAFEAAARLLSFKRAAAELGVTPTAISHQIRQLEEMLGIELFVREARRVTLTAAGQRLYPGLARGFDAIAEAVAAVGPRPARQIATLSATVAFTGRLLVPHAASFRALHPGWDLRLQASDEPVDLIAGEADAAIRYGTGVYPGLTAMPLLTDSFAPVASPRLGLKQPEDLRRSTLIHFDWIAEARLRDIDAEGGIAFNDENSAIQATIAGQGVALLSLALVAPELKAGLLVRPFGPELLGWRYDFVYPTGAENRPAVAALRQWVTTVLIRNLPTESGGNAAS
jgi:LysR family glycine cleavage system transcriptional activator